MDCYVSFNRSECFINRTIFLQLCLDFNNTFLFTYLTFNRDPFETKKNATHMFDICVEINVKGISLNFDYLV